MANSLVGAMGSRMADLQPLILPVSYQVILPKYKKMGAKRQCRKHDIVTTFEEEC